MNKIQLRKKIHSDFVCVDLRNTLLDNASFINIKSAKNLHKYHECTCDIYIFVQINFTHTQINSLTITHYII